MDAYPVEDVGVEDFNSGIGFTPATWPVNTRVTLCNVPWDSDYNNVVYFSSAANRDSYFSGLSSTSLTLTGLTYCKPNEPVFINTPYNRAYTYNYLVVENPSQPVPGEVTPPKLYYFITGVSMIAPNTTGLYLQLDVWMTYHIGMTLGRCFVERGHVAYHAFKKSVGQGNTDMTLAKRYLTVPEGLDVGSNYMINYEEPLNYTSISSDGGYIIISAADLRTPGAAADAQSLLETYYGTVDNPKLPTAKGSNVAAQFSGCDVYFLFADNFIAFMTNLRTFPWISSQILAIIAFPLWVVNHWRPHTTVKIAGTYGFSFGNTSDDWTAALDGIENITTKFNRNKAISNWTKHPKSRVWPYAFLRLTNYESAPVTLKYEMMNSETLALQLISNPLPPSPSFMVFPSNYGYHAYEAGAWVADDYSALGETSDRPHAITPDGTYARIDNLQRGEKLDNALIWSYFPSTGIVNDGYINYLASTSGSRAFGRDNAGWLLDKSLANANVSYDNANRSLGAAQANQQLAYETQRQISQYNIGNLVGNSLRDTYNSLSGNAQGGINGLFGGLDVSQVINTTVAAANGSMANELGNQQFWNTQQAQQGNIDANYKLQQWAARGDYQQSIAAIDASVQDAQVASPTVSGSLGGTGGAIAWINGLNGGFAQFMTIDAAHQSAISHYWDRFGYAVHDYVYIGSNFNLMNYFTYWKLSDVVLSRANIDDGTRLILKGIFEKGVTVWNGNPSYITGGMQYLYNNDYLSAVNALY